jgi:hypothetical protein
MAGSVGLVLAPRHGRRLFSNNKDSFEPTATNARSALAPESFTTWARMAISPAWYLATQQRAAGQPHRVEPHRVEPHPVASCRTPSAPRRAGTGMHGG